MDPVMHRWPSPSPRLDYALVVPVFPLGRLDILLSNPALALPGFDSSNPIRRIPGERSEAVATSRASRAKPNERFCIRTSSVLVPQRPRRRVPSGHRKMIGPIVSKTGLRHQSGATCGALHSVGRQVRYNDVRKQVADQRVT
jgi:hypothetical protein